MAAAIAGFTMWTVAGAALAVATFLITVVVNVPLNAALDRAVVDGAAGEARARRAFERPWVRANIVRTTTGVAATLCLTVALVAL